VAGRKQDIPWEKIRNEYITAVPKRSYRELAAKYKVSPSQVGVQGRKEKWVQLRKEHWDKITTKSLQKTVDQIAEEIADMNVRHATTGRELLAAGRSRLRNLLEKAKELAGRLGEDELPTGQAMRAIELGVKIERLARGEPTEIEKEVVTFQDLVAKAKENGESK
jgi:hypothetical protein